MAETRLLITIGTSSHLRAREWDRPTVAEDLRRVHDLFVDRFGYRHVPILGPNPTAADIRTELRRFARDPSRDAADYVVVYVVGHGELLDGTGDHVLITTDTDPDDIAFSGIRTSELGRIMLEETGVRRLLLILDTCHSGAGGYQLLSPAEHGTWQNRLGRDDEPALVVVMAARPAERARAGAFSSALVRAVDNLATAGYALEVMPIDAVLGVLQHDTEIPTWQQVHWFATGAAGRLPAFLRNPRYRPWAAGLPVGEIDRLVAEARRERMLREEEMRTHFLPRARGADGPGDEVWRFVGRHRILADVVSWLADPRTQRACVVTGAPGSGKSAVLGLLAALADSRRLPGVPELGLPDEAFPPVGAITVAVQASYRTVDQVLASIAAAAGVTAGSLGRLLAALEARSTPIVVLIDAVDEAQDPQRLAQSLLRPFIESQFTFPVRLLLGTRPHVLPWLGAAPRILDLDDADYADPASVRAYARRLLVDGAPASHYPERDNAYVDGVADAVAEAAGRSFLVARITALTLSAIDELPPDPHDPDWREGLPRLPGEAMRQDLDKRLGTLARKARELLIPLAFAQGAGLPQEDVWAPLATRLSGTVYGDDDLVWLRDAAGSYFVESTEDGRSVYRVFHRALVEHLRENGHEIAIHLRFTDFLLDHTRRRGGWARSHPYARVYLAIHAQRAGRLPDVMCDPAFLLHADVDQLVAASATDDDRAVTRAYRRVAHRLRDRGSPIDERLAYLNLAAHCLGVGALVDAIAELGIAMPWRVRWARWNHEPARHGFFAHENQVLERLRVVAGSGRPELWHHVQRWDARTGIGLETPELWRKNDYSGWVVETDVARIGDRTLLAAVTNTGRLSVVDLDTNTVLVNRHLGLGSRDSPHEPASRDRVRGMRFIRTRVPRIAVWDDRGELHLVPALTRRRTRVFEAGTFGSITACVAARTPDGNEVVVVGTADGRVCYADVQGGAPSVQEAAPRHTAAISDLAVCPLESHAMTVISAALDGTVCSRRLGVFDEAATAHGLLMTSTSTIGSLAVHAVADRWILTAAAPGEGILRYDLTNNQTLPIIRGYGYNHVVTTELDETPTVIAGGWGTHAWELTTGKSIAGAVVPPHDPVTCVAAIPGTRDIVAGHRSGIVTFQDRASPHGPSASREAHRGPVLEVAPSTATRRPVTPSAMPIRSMSSASARMPGSGSGTAATGNARPTAASRTSNCVVPRSASSHREPWPSSAVYGARSARSIPTRARSCSIFPSPPTCRPPLPCSANREPSAWSSAPTTAAWPCGTRQRARGAIPCPVPIPDGSSRLSPYHSTPAWS